MPQTCRWWRRRSPHAPPGPYALQAAIAEHARAPRAETTDWRTIARHSRALVRIRPTPVVELDRAIAMVDGPAAGLQAP